MKKWTYKTDEAVYLKMKLSTYPGIESMLRRCLNEIDRITTIVIGIKSSSDYSEVPSDNPTYRNKVIQFDKEKGEWEEKLKKHRIELKELEDIIDSIEDETDRQFIRDVYKVGLSNKRLAYKYHYNDEKYIYKKIDLVLKKIGEKM